MNCSNCNNDLPNDSEFCQFCGNKIEAPPVNINIDNISKEFCKKCGEKLLQNVKFCNKCGEPIKLVCCRCGSELRDNEHFCHSFGKKVKPYTLKSKVQKKRRKPMFFVLIALVICTVVTCGFFIYNSTISIKYYGVLKSSTSNFAVPCIAQVKYTSDGYKLTSITLPYGKSISDLDVTFNKRNKTSVNIKFGAVNSKITAYFSGISKATIKQKELIKKYKKSTGTYCASKSSDIYHICSCSYANSILDKNIIYFSSATEAIIYGFEPCSHCIK